MSDKKLLTYWLSVILWFGVIYWMSSGTFASSQTSKIIEPLLRFLMPTISAYDVQLIHAVIRKMAHVTEYFVLGLLLYRAFKGDSTVIRMRRWIFSSLLVLALFALTDEFHQSFVATRTASLMDAGIDIFGGVLSQCFIVLRYRRKKIIST